MVQLEKPKDQSLDLKCKVFIHKNIVFIIQLKRQLPVAGKSTPLPEKSMPTLHH